MAWVQHRCDITFIQMMSCCHFKLLPVVWKKLKQSKMAGCKVRKGIHAMISINLPLKVKNLWTPLSQQIKTHLHTCTVRVIVKVTFRLSATIVARRYGFLFRLVLTS